MASDLVMKIGKVSSSMKIASRNRLEPVVSDIPAADFSDSLIPIVDRLSEIVE